MKYLNKIMLMLLMVSVSFSCDNFDLELQEDPNNLTAENASLTDLFNSVQLTFVGVVATLEKAPGSAVRMYHAGAFTYEAWTTPNTFVGLWTIAYAGLFPDIDALIALADAGGFEAHSAIAKILKAHALMAMVDVFGNIPFSEAGNGVEIISPNVDDGATVYAAAIALLNEAATTLGSTVSAAPTSDFFYGGDLTKWITLSNTLRLRAALNMGDASTINSLVAAGDLIDTEAEDFQFSAGTNRLNPDSRHPFYANHYESIDGDYLSNYFMWVLLEDKVDGGGIIVDPRIRYYFYRKISDAFNQDPTTYSCHYADLPTTPVGSNLNHWDAIDTRLRASYCVNNNGYGGRSHLNGTGIPPDGPTRTSYGLYPFGGDFDNDEFADTRNAGTTGGGGEGIIPIMVTSLVDLMRAEAVLSLGTSGDARALMESGIRASMAKVVAFEGLVSTKMNSTESVSVGGGVFEDRAVSEIYGINGTPVGAAVTRLEDYVARTLALYDAASAAGQLDMVIKENYVASWGNGLEAYNMYRRTGYPSNMQPALESDAGNFPNSFFYPANFETRNANVEQKADLTELVFWDAGTTTRY